jgi:4-amino-4-deoxy-L-arabinose transferase-like glycosyltransferase
MRRLLPLALVGLLGLTLLPGLAAIEAIDWREARDAQVTRESSMGREWVTPVFGHEPFFEKPLFAYAPELIAQKLLHRESPQALASTTDVAASRAVRAAIAAVLALLVAVIGTRAFGSRAGWLAGCALASTVGLPLAARADGGQMLATLCAWLGIGALLEVLQGRARTPGLTRYFAWFAFGAAVVVGGPLPALWPLGGIALYFALARSRAAWRAVRPGSGLLVVLAMALPWYGIMTALYGRPFLAHVPFFPYAIGPRDHWLASPLMALSYPMVLGFPWSPLLAASLRDTAERLRRRGIADLHDSGHAASLVMCLFVAASVPIALVPHPPLTAALPALPAMALLCGRFLDRVLDGDVDARLLTGATRLAAALGTVLALLAALIATRIPDAAHGLQTLGAALLLASWAPLLADFAGRRKLAAALFALPVAFGAPLLETLVLPALEPWLNTCAAAEAMQAVAPPRAPLVLLEPAPPSLRLLLPHNLVEVRSLAQGMPALAARDGNVYVAFPPAREHEAARTAPAPLEILLRSPTLVLARIGVAPHASSPSTGSPP